MKDLLICIAFHYNLDRLVYLNTIISNFVDNYNCSLDIIVDTNNLNLQNNYNDDRITVITNLNLLHPFYLTWQHRKHILEKINDYKNFMYVEDDMYLSYDNYLNYLENFKLLYPTYVPSFIRVEQKDNINYVSDILEPQNLKIINILNKQFHELPFYINYHAFWIMPQKELKESITKGFDQANDSRETAAMYVGWGLNKRTLIEINNGTISEKCYSYHLPNNYAFCKDLKNGKLEVKNIFV